MQFSLEVPRDVSFGDRAFSPDSRYYISCRDRPLVGCRHRLGRRVRAGDRFAMGRSDLAQVAISGSETSLTQALPDGAGMFVRVHARNACGQSQPSGELLVSQF